MSSCGWFLQDRVVIQKHQGEMSLGVLQAHTQDLFNMLEAAPGPHRIHVIHHFQDARCPAPLDLVRLRALASPVMHHKRLGSLVAVGMTCIHLKTAARMIAQVTHKRVWLADNIEAAADYLHYMDAELPPLYAALSTYSGI